MALSDTAIRNAKAAGAAVKLSDGAGMYSSCSPADPGCGRTTTASTASARRSRSAPTPPWPWRWRGSGALRKIEKRTARLAGANAFEAVGREWVAKPERARSPEYSIRQERLQGGSGTVFHRA
jgi:hypothetical protein